MWKVTKGSIPYVLGVFFGVVLSIFTEESKKMNSVWDFWTFWNSIRFVFPFIFMVLLISIGTDVMAFGLEKTKKNIPAKLLAIKNWIHKERLSVFEKKLIVGENGISLNIKPEKRFPFSSRLSVVTSYIEEKPHVSKRDYKSKLDYDSARTSSLIKNWSPKGLEVISNIKVSKGKNEVFEIFTLDGTEDIFWAYRKSGKPEVFWNADKFRELEYMSFGFGKYEFRLSIKNTGIFGINFNEKYSFIITYGKTGIVLES